MSAYRDRRRALTLLAALPLFDSPTARAERDHANQWRPDPRLARGSPHSKTRRAHHLCGGGCPRPGAPGHEGHQRGCGTHSPAHCGGRYFAARTRISFCKDDNSYRLARGEKRQARIRERGW